MDKPKKGRLVTGEAAKREIVDNLKAALNAYVTLKKMGRIS